jgi:D-glycerate 3-kinase
MMAVINGNLKVDKDQTIQSLDLNGFISQHQLPQAYVDHAKRWFFPMAKAIADKQKKTSKAIILGINGAQGSGKSTLADLLAYLFRENYQLNVVVLSIDDFYLTRQQREVLSKSVHPLLTTRGVPGTHDIGLAINVINSLCDTGNTTFIPRFDKATDDRVAEQNWDKVSAKTDIIILEGWCLGAEQQADEDLLEPINELEKEEDSDASWRKYVNRQLGGLYQDLFDMVDSWIMLKAPSFDCIYQWRLEQENKLRHSLLNATSGSDDNRVMDDSGVKRFIQHYQRITEQLLDTLPGKVDYLFEMDKNRKIIRCSFTE